jgi:hypothetical protein
VFMSSSTIFRAPEVWLMSTNVNAPALELPANVHSAVETQIRVGSRLVYSRRGRPSVDSACVHPSHAESQAPAECGWAMIKQGARLEKNDHAPSQKIGGDTVAHKHQTKCIEPCAKNSMRNLRCAVACNRYNERSQSFHDNGTPKMVVTHARTQFKNAFLLPSANRSVMMIQFRLYAAVLRHHASRHVQTMR